MHTVGTHPAQGRLSIAQYVLAEWNVSGMEAQFWESCCFLPTDTSISPPDWLKQQM